MTENTKSIPLDVLAAVFGTRESRRAEQSSDAKTKSPPAGVEPRPTKIVDITHLYVDKSFVFSGQTLPAEDEQGKK